SYFLNSLRRDIKALSDFLVKFFMQNVFQILSSYFSRDNLFFQGILKNVGVVKPCYGLICGEEISQRKKFMLTFSETFTVMLLATSMIIFSERIYLYTLSPHPLGWGLLEVVR
ncbi:MAG: hypothetical protein N2V77_01830, partial [Canidatus Methanoxibalbensis ujae]|nr:hypothetical protein [Candidatus Methanoxibalbensis ujae]